MFRRPCTGPEQYHDQRDAKQTKYLEDGALCDSHLETQMEIYSAYDIYPNMKMRAQRASPVHLQEYFFFLFGDASVLACSRTTFVFDTTTVCNARTSLYHLVYCPRPRPPRILNLLPVVIPVYCAPIHGENR